MSDDEHPELDFDPLDDTKLWPRTSSVAARWARMVLNRTPRNYFAEVEQARSGPGVLVDGPGLLDDKMLQGRTLSYSDTQRYRVGPELPAAPINAPKKHVATNQRDGQMTYHVDLTPGGNPHVNYEPSSLGGWSRRSAPARTTRPTLPGPGAADDRAHQRLQAGRRALPDVRGLGARRPDLNLVNT
jgi:catalase